MTKAVTGKKRRIDVIGLGYVGLPLAVEFAVPHRSFLDLGLKRIRRFAKPKHVIYDVKYLFKRNATDGRL